MSSAKLIVLGILFDSNLRRMLPMYAEGALSSNAEFSYYIAHELDDLTGYAESVKTTLLELKAKQSCVAWVDICSFDKRRAAALDNISRDLMALGICVLRVGHPSNDTQIPLDACNGVIDLLHYDAFQYGILSGTYWIIQKNNNLHSLLIRKKIAWFEAQAFSFILKTLS